MSMRERARIERPDTFKPPKLSGDSNNTQMLRIRDVSAGTQIVVYTSRGERFEARLCGPCPQKRQFKNASYLVEILGHHNDERKDRFTILGSGTAVKIKTA